jgi:hypothetical protein
VNLHIAHDAKDLLMLPNEWPMDVTPMVLELANRELRQPLQAIKDFHDDCRSSRSSRALMVAIRGHPR